MALPFEARPPVKGMEKPILIGSAARTVFGPSRAGSASAAAANACRNIVLQYIGFAPLTLLFVALQWFSRRDRPCAPPRAQLPTNPCRHRRWRWHRETHHARRWRRAAARWPARPP